MDIEKQLRGALARGYCAPINAAKVLDPELIEAMVQEMVQEVARGIPSCKRPHLGLATTGELLDELRARIEMHALGGLAYRTVDGESFASKVALPSGR